MSQETDGTANRVVKPRNIVRWTAAMRDTFLDHLAATCNVRESARVTGIDPAACYRRRRRDPAFAAKWQDALALGYEMLETQLVGHALAGDESGELVDGRGAAMGPNSVTLALSLLTIHRNATGKPRQGGPPKRYASAEETDAVLMAKLAQLEARRAARATAAEEAV